MERAIIFPTQRTMIKNDLAVTDRWDMFSPTELLFSIKISGPGSSQISDPASSQGLEELVTNNRNYELSTRFNNYSRKQEKENFYQIKNWMKKILIHCDFNRHLNQQKERYPIKQLQRFCQEDNI